MESSIDAAEGPALAETPRTETETSPSRAERFAPLVAGLLVAVPTLAAYYLPMTDLPLHEGMVGLLRHYGDPAYAPPGLYTLNLGRPNQLFYIVAWILSYGMSTAWAVKLVIAASQVLIFTSGAHFARYLGRSTWSVLLFAPLALGFTFYWGLIANLVGFAAFFYTLPTLDRFVEKPTARAIPAVLGALALQYYAHGSVFMIGVSLIGGLALLKELELRATALRLAPVALGGGAVLISKISQERLFTRGAFQAPTGYLGLGQKIQMIPNVLFGSHDEVIRVLLFFVAALSLGVLIAARRKEPGPTLPETVGRLRRARAWLHEYRFEALGFAFLAGYFLLPFNYHGATLIHERAFGPAWGLFVVTAAPRGAAPRIAKLTGAVVTLGVLLVGWPQFVDSSRTNHELEELIVQIPKGHTSTVVSIDRKHPGLRTYAAPIAGLRALALRGGRTGMSLVISPIAPVQIPPDLRWNDYELRELIYQARGFKPAHDFKNFEYVIVQTREPAMQRLVQVAFAPEADFLGTRGEWSLFRSRLPLFPIMSGDHPAPNDLDTAYDRLGYLVAKVNGEPATMPPSMSNVAPPRAE